MIRYLRDLHQDFLLWLNERTNPVLRLGRMLGGPYALPLLSWRDLRRAREEKNGEKNGRL